MSTDPGLQLGDVALGEAAAAQTLTASLCVSEGHPCLVGHFPGAPIVPGVLLVEAVRLACERALGGVYAIAEIVDVRFYQPVLPGQRVTVAAQWVVEQGALLVDGRWRNSEGLCAALQLRLVRREP